MEFLYPQELITRAFGILTENSDFFHNVTECLNTITSIIIVVSSLYDLSRNGIFGNFFNASDKMKI